VVRAFVHFRRELLEHDELAREPGALMQSLAPLDAQARHRLMVTTPKRQ
jgi:hypothetical protein